MVGWLTLYRSHVGDYSLAPNDPCSVFTGGAGLSWNLHASLNRRFECPLEQNTSHTVLPENGNVPVTLLEK